MRIPLQSLTKPELIALLSPVVGPSKAKYQAKQIYNWVYQRFTDDWDLMTDLSKVLRQWCKDNLEILRLKEKVSQTALDGTHKFLWQLQDDRTIESVIIPAALEDRDAVEAEERLESESSGDARFSGRKTEMTLQERGWKRLTACISSQVGCAMACKFCLTGIQGLDRHLKVEEIVTQIHELRRLAPITNIVFMGMGEPLHNLQNVIKACQILLDQDGFNFSKRKVTVSTSGIVPALKELGEKTGVSLAVSLNATTDEQRSEIMPVNKRWPIAELLKGCREYPLGTHRRVTFEYVMLAGFNDSDEDLERLIQIARTVRCKINLIPFNAHSGADYKRPSDARVLEFQRKLLNAHLTATVRISRGRDISAACGQLRSLFGTARGTEKHRDYAEKSVSA